MNTWDIARRPMKCTSLNCTTVIGEGEQFRWMAGGKWAICPPCAKRRLDEDPPEHMPAMNVLDRLKAGGRITGMTPVGEVIPADFKVAQYEREPGEDG